MEPNPPLGGRIGLADVAADLAWAPAVNHSLLTVRPASQWLDIASTRPIPAELFGPLWFEGEVCILFADMNVGKSILAVQIADALSRADRVAPFDPHAVPLKVLYTDFELSDRQFELRYSNEAREHYRFSDQFLRAEINPDYEGEEAELEALILKSFEELVVAHGVQVLIVDNLTYLSTENEKARNALPLMKALKALKNRYSLSVLILAHTPKRDSAKPIGSNDLAGSKMLINFADSAFTIGASAVDSALRYLKQIKVRNTELLYGIEQVITFEIVKQDNFLHFEHVGYDSELLHLKSFSREDQEELEEQVLDLHRQRVPHREIARQVGISPSKAYRIINK